MAPSTEEQFIECFLHKRRLFIKSNDARRAEALLPRWMLDRLIASDFLPTERLSVLQGGSSVAQGRFRNPDGRLRQGALDDLTAEGVSFVVNRIDDDVPSIARLSASLQRRLGHRLWVNSYVTYGPGGALRPHYDDHDVIVLQIHGSKRWFGHGAPYPSPIRPSLEDEDFGPPVWEELLAPGDVLYLPRGEVHHTSVEGASSVHLTLGVETRRGVDFLAKLVGDAELDAEFRLDLTRLGGAEALERQERHLKDKMHALIEQADLRAYLLEDEGSRGDTCPKP